LNKYLKWLIGHLTKCINSDPYSVKGFLLIMSLIIIGEALVHVRDPEVKEE